MGSKKCRVWQIRIYCSRPYCRHVKYKVSHFAIYGQYDQYVMCTLLRQYCYYFLFEQVARFGNLLFEKLRSKRTKGTSKRGNFSGKRVIGSSSPSWSLITFEVPWVRNRGSIPPRPLSSSTLLLCAHLPSYDVLLAVTGTFSDFPSSRFSFGSSLDGSQSPFGRCWFQLVNY